MRACCIFSILSITKKLMVSPKYGSVGETSSYETKYVNKNFVTSSSFLLLSLSLQKDAGWLTNPV